MPRYRKGDVLWLLPIRYWEVPEPSRCVVVSDNEKRRHMEMHDDPGVCRGLLVNSEEWGHTVYVEHENVFFTRECAIEVIRLRVQLREMRSKDDGDIIMSRILVEEATGGGFPQ